MPRSLSPPIAQEMPALMRLNAAAYISPQNYPILVRNFTSAKQDDLKYHYVAHTSLDVIEERRRFCLFVPLLTLAYMQGSSCKFEAERMLSWLAVFHGGLGCIWLRDTNEAEDCDRIGFVGCCRAGRGCYFGLPYYCDTSPRSLRMFVLLHSHNRFSKHYIQHIAAHLPTHF